MTKEIPHFEIIVLFSFLFISCASVLSQWEKALGDNKVSSYEQFLAKNPNSEYAEQAKEKIAELKHIEAENKNTIEAYEEFIVEAPDSPLVNEAKMRIKE